MQESNQITIRDMAEGTFLVSWPKWVRWTLFLPSAILAPILFFLIQNIFGGYAGLDSNSFLLILSRSIIYGGGFVFAGSVVAPAHQKIIALLLLIIVAMISGMGLLSAIITSSSWINVMEGLITVGSAGYMTYFIYSNS